MHLQETARTRNASPESLSIFTQQMRPSPRSSTGSGFGIWLRKRGHDGSSGLSSCSLSVPRSAWKISSAPKQSVIDWKGAEVEKAMAGAVNSPVGFQVPSETIRIYHSHYQVLTSLSDSGSASLASLQRFTISTLTITTLILKIAIPIP